MIVIGLTGSIGMGKTVTANLFRAAGVAVHDSDAVVHRLYGGAAAPLIESVFPGVVREAAVDRRALAARVLADEAAMKRLEAIIHPMVEADRTSFRLDQERRGAKIIVLDIPLLFEIGYDREVDVVVVVAADNSVQKSRVMARPGMTAEHFEAIVARQTPNAEKLKRAHFVVQSDRGLAFAERQVSALIRCLSGAASS